MKILYVANFEDIHSAKWAQFFIDRGHEVRKFHVLKFSLCNFLLLLKEIWRFQPDILHAQYCGANGLLCALTGFHPFIGTVHGSEVLLTRGIKRLLVKWVLKKADLITTDGFHMIHSLMGMGVSKGKINLVWFGVDCEKFKPGNTGFYPPVVAYRTGPDLLYEEKVILKAKEIISDHYRGAVHFQPIKDMKEHEVIFFLQNATIYVSAARSDAGLSSTTAEAMACGLPVVVSDVADNFMWVHHEWLFPVGDAEALALKVIQLLEDDALRGRVGLENRAIIKNGNNYHTEMSKMETIYQNIIKEQRHGRFVCSKLGTDRN